MQKFTFTDIQPNLCQLVNIDPDCVMVISFKRLRYTNIENCHDYNEQAMIRLLELIRLLLVISLLEEICLLEMKRVLEVITYVVWT